MISAVIIAKNEEDKIAACLDSVSFADEIVFVDDGSTDKTIEIAKQYTTTIYYHKSVGYVEPARNFAIAKARNEWILLLDADELVPETLKQRLKEIAIEENNVDAVFIPRKNIIFNKWIEHTGWWPDNNMRFFRKRAVSWSDRIHSQPHISGKQITLAAKEEYALIHERFTHVSQFLKMIDAYTTIQAKEYLEKNATFSWLLMIKEPWNEFLTRYFAWQGYKDGLHGLMLSLLMAFYILIMQLKVWEQKGFTKHNVSLQDVEKQILARNKELVYWFDREEEATIHQSSFQRKIHSLRRKIYAKFL